MLIRMGGMSQAMTNDEREAFTLIELLVVVAILSILASIGASNYMESTVRARVSRTKMQMSLIANSLEAYFVDNNHYLAFARSGNGLIANQVVLPMSRRLSPLTTPISYISSVPTDVFEAMATTDGSPLVFFDTYDYADVPTLAKFKSPKLAGLTSGGIWRLSSPGPDRIQAYGGSSADEGLLSISNRFGVDYDPTNGTVSAGDIVRVGPPSEEGTAPGIRRTHGYEELFHWKNP